MKNNPCTVTHPDNLDFSGVLLSITLASKGWGTMQPGKLAAKERKGCKTIKTLLCANAKKVERKEPSTCLLKENTYPDFML
ncbi:MAG: hypothetical protein KAU94_13355 [Verrucomicrobia bacterium]|nr:hypothetical protein [Verrucomicrobiota bacterium]